MEFWSSGDIFISKVSQNLGKQKNALIFSQKHDQNSKVFELTLLAPGGGVFSTSPVQKMPQNSKTEEVITLKLDGFSQICIIKIMNFIY